MTTSKQRHIRSYCQRTIWAAAIISTAWGTPRHSIAAEPKAKSSEQSQPNAYRKAKALYDANKFQDCKQLLKSAGTLTPKMETLLAQTECELHEFRACAMHAAESLKWPGHKPDARKGLEEMLAEAVRELEVLTLTVNTNDAEVSVDGEPLGSTPVLDPIYLEPGTRKLTITKPGYATISRDLESHKGATVSLAIELQQGPEVKPVAAAPSHTAPNADEKAGRAKPTPAPVRDAPRESNEPDTRLLMVGGVAAVGGLVAGLYFNLHSNSKYDEARDVQNRLAPGACAPGSAASSANCASLHESLKDGDRARNYSAAAFVIGGAALVGTVVYWAWPRSGRTAARSGLQMTASAFPGNTWIGVSSAF
jgi:hypothetical protein